MSETYRLLNDPAGQAAFMLPRLNEAQRDFIVRMKPTLSRQRVRKADHELAWPGVSTGEEWPDQFWFGGGEAHFPAGRRPLGNKRCSYSFRFNEAGLLLRDALAAGTRSDETNEDLAKSEGCQSGGDSRNAQTPVPSVILRR